MALEDIKSALEDFIKDSMIRGGNLNMDALSSFILKTKANQKAQFLAWATNRKNKLNSQKLELAANKLFHESRIDKQIADIVDAETNL